MSIECSDYHWGDYWFMGPNDSEGHPQESESVNLESESY